MPQQRFVLVAGEASGDLLGADLIAGLRARFPRAHFAGIGGERMRAAGMDIWHPAERLSVMGLVEVLRHLPSLLALRREVYKRALAFAPAAFIGIDAPDFNLGLERRLKRAGIRTAHYVSPSVWAWREGRASNIGRSAERVLCLFPIEPPIYARHGVKACFVGHPLARAFDDAPDKSAARTALGLRTGARILALLPGSRLDEIARLGRDFLDAAALLRREFPDLHVVIPAANAACAEAIRGLIRDSANSGDSGLGARDSEVQVLLPSDISIFSSDSSFRIFDCGHFNPSSISEPQAPSPESRLSNSYLALLAADAVLLASGTAALEAMLAKRPMVVAYRVAPMTYGLVKGLGLLKTQVYSLPNILAGKTLVPERMQDDCTPQALAAALAPMLAARRLPDETRLDFDALHDALRGDPQHDAAAAVAGMLDE